MKFQQGHKFAKGGKRPGAGRPTKEKQEIKKQAAEVAREFIETHVQKFLDSYLDLAAGKVVERLDKDGNVVKLVMLDPATVRHAIDKILPDEQMEHTQPIEIVFQDFARPSKPITGLEGYVPDRPRNLPAPADPCRLPPPTPAAKEQTELKHPQVKFQGFASGNGKRRQ
jgi:hypothetical protein